MEWRPFAAQDSPRDKCLSGAIYFVLELYGFQEFGRNFFRLLVAKQI
jgi:hypothetical protein